MPSVRGAAVKWKVPSELREEYHLSVISQSSGKGVVAFCHLA